MTIKTKQKLIVNVESAAGAQPLTITFTYTDDKGSSITETQTITLLVYSPMQIDVSFSGATPALIVDEGAPLTLQVTNLGKKTVLLGSLEAKGDDMDVEAANTIIGSLDSGGFFTADVKITPKKAGALKLMVRIHYLDDFGKQRALSRSLLIKAEQPPTPIPVMEDTSQQAGTGLWDQIVRFIKGLFGLESAPAEGTLPSGAPEGQPMPLVEPQG